MVKSPLFPALLLLLYMEAYGFRRLFFDNLIKQTDTFVIQRATGTVRHDLSDKKASDPRSDPRATCGMVTLP